MAQNGQSKFPNTGLRWFAGVLVLIIFLGWLLNTPEGVMGKADAIGYAVCHRIDLRSFHLGERPLPLCARCTGMYLGALTGLVFQMFWGRRRTGTPPFRVIIVLILFVAGFALDGGNSFLALLFQKGPLYEPNNTLRLFTGTGMGLVIAAALFPAFNQTVWREYEVETSLKGFKSLLILIGIAIIIDLLVLSGNPLILYPLALISAGGVLIVLTTLYTMVSVIIFGKENQFDRAYQLFFYILVGFGTGLLQIAVLDGIRFILTGTWEGFHFG